MPPHLDGGQAPPPHGHPSISAGGQSRIWEYFQTEARACFAGAHERLSFLLRDVRAGERLLDIGVGDGTLLRLARARGADVHALDPSARTIDALRTELGLGERAQSGVAAQAPFPDAHFDVVVMSEVLEHLATDDIRSSLREVARILRPGGRLVGTVPAHEDLAQQTVLCPRCGESFHRWGHLQSFDAPRLRALLAEALEVERVDLRLFPPWSSLNWKGRLQWAGKLALFHLGVHGASENFHFVARRPTSPRA